MTYRLEEDLKIRSKEIYDDLRESTYFLSKNKKYTNRELKFNIIDNDHEINGQAWTEDMFDNVEIFSGVFKINELYFKKVVSFLLENNLKEQPYNDELLKKINLINGGNINELNNVLIIFVNRFILVHEFGHLFNGHCDYNNYISDKKNPIKMVYLSRNSDENLSEENSKMIDSDGLEVERSMEMDADSFAVTRSMFHLVGLSMKFDEKAGISILKKEDIFFWWAFSIASFFMIIKNPRLLTGQIEDFEKEEFDYLEDYNYKTHLPSSARIAMAVNTAVEVLQRYFNEVEFLDITKAKKDMYVGTNCAQIIFNSINGTNYCLSEQLLENENLCRYFQEVHETWKELRNKLEPFSRLKLYGL